MATYTNLDNEIFARSSLEAFVKEMAPISAFSVNYSPNPPEKGNNVLVPLVSALTATTFGGSYAITGGTKTVVTVTINRHKVVHIGQSDLEAAGSSESALESFFYQQGAALAQCVIEDIFTLLTTANYTSVSAISTTDIAVSHLRLGRLRLNQANVPKNPRNLILDCVPYDALLGITNFVQAHMIGDALAIKEGRIPRALGFALYEQNSSFGSVNSVMGFFAHAAAIAVAVRYLQPQKPDAYTLARPIGDPATGLVLGLRDMYDPLTGQRYVALECNYGYSVGISNAGRLLKQLD